MFSSSGKQKEALIVPEWKEKNSALLGACPKAHASAWHLLAAEWYSASASPAGVNSLPLKVYRCSHQQLADKELVQIPFLQGLQIEHCAINQQAKFLLKPK